MSVVLVVDVGASDDGVVTEGLPANDGSAAVSIFADVTRFREEDTLLETGIQEVLVGGVGG